MVVLFKWVDSEVREEMDDEVVEVGLDVG